MDATYSKQEKLKKKKLIELLFQEGQSIKAFPVRLIYLPHAHNGPGHFQTGVSVSKKKFKSAVDRNRIKRLLREAYRLEKGELTENPDTKKHLFMFIYFGDKEVSLESLRKSLRRTLKIFEEKQQRS